MTGRTVFRIATDALAFAADDLSGAGAERDGGRWNAPGTAVLYASESRALACLETLVYLNAGGLPMNRYLVEIAIPDAVWREREVRGAAALPVGWDAAPASLSSVGFGTEWARSRRSPVLVVPSVMVEEECTVLLNPAHPSAAQIRAGKRRRWLFDPRTSAPALERRRPAG